MRGAVLGLLQLCLTLQSVIEDGCMDNTTTIITIMMTKNILELVSDIGTCIGLELKKKKVDQHISNVKAFLVFIYNLFLDKLLRP